MTQLLLGTISIIGLLYYIDKDLKGDNDNENI